MPPWLLHELDFSRFSHYAVYEFATNNYELIAEIQNQSFLNSIKKCFIEMGDDDEFFDEDLCDSMTIDQLKFFGNFKYSDDPNLIGSLFKKQHASELSA